MRETDHPAGRGRKLRSRPMSAGQVLVVGAIVFVGAAFLNSQTLLDMAERQPYGWQRTIAVDLARPLHTVSQWTGLAKPGEKVDEARGRNSGSADSFDALDIVHAADRVVGRSAHECGWRTDVGGRSRDRHGDERTDDRTDDRPSTGCRRAAPHSHRGEPFEDVDRRRLDGLRGRAVALSRCR